MADVAVLVPLWKRVGNVARVAASFAGSNAEGARLYFIVDPEDRPVIQAVHGTGRFMIVSDRGHTYAKKINCGYRCTTEPWLFTAADDVHFHPGWLQAARPLLNRFSVVGSNDRGNPFVTNGVHATHMFISRAYATRLGASLDGPGVVFHEGYRHQYCDVEVVALARKRKVWSPCLASVVEHLHPNFGKATRDAVYQTSDAAAGADAALYRSRAAKHGLWTVVP